MDLVGKIQIKINLLVSPFIGRIMRPLYRYRYLSAPSTYEYIFIDPEEVKYWYGRMPHREIVFEGQIKSGDWSSNLRDAKDVFERSNKLNGIIQHFVDEVPWNETSYLKKYENTISDKNKVETTFEKACIKTEKLYSEIKQNGFKTSSECANIKDIFVHIYKNGEIVYTADGNHRLAIAKSLGLKKIPVRVYRRHSDWMEIRDRYFKNPYDSIFDIKKMRNHPDLISLKCI